MKTIKYLTVIFVMAFSNCGLAQINEKLSSAEWNALEINGVSFEKIHDTKADISQMKSLFGGDLSIHTGEDKSLWISFSNKSKGFSIRFSDLFGSPDTGTEYGLAAFEILNSNSSLTIRGMNVTIGDPVSKLRGARKDSERSMVSFGSAISNVMLLITYDSIGKITKIEFLYGA